MMVSGYQEQRRDMEFGRVSMVILILANGKIAKLMVMVCISGRMVIATRENGGVVFVMVTAQIFSQMEIVMLDSIN